MLYFAYVHSVMTHDVIYYVHTKELAVLLLLVFCRIHYKIYI